MAALHTSQTRAALLVAATDLRRRLRNRSFLIQALVGPIALAGIISLAFGSGGGFSATIGVVDDDGSPMAAAFVTGVTEADAGDLEFVAVDSAGAARTGVAAGDLSAAIVVPDGFATSLQTEAPGDLDVITSADNAVSGPRSAIRNRPRRPGCPSPSAWRCSAGACGHSRSCRR